MDLTVSIIDLVLPQLVMTAVELVSSYKYSLCNQIKQNRKITVQFIVCSLFLYLLVCASYEGHVNTCTCTLNKCTNSNSFSLLKIPLSIQLSSLFFRGYVMYFNIGYLYACLPLTCAILANEF